MTSSPFLDRSLLVIDDDAFTRKVMARMATHLGFATVHQAADGSEGVDMVAAHHPDLVLCDFEMSPMNGLGFLHAVRDAGFDALPVAFVTNRIDETRREQASRLGVDTFLTKPPTPQQLSDALARSLTARRTG